MSNLDTVYFIREIDILLSKDGNKVSIYTIKALEARLEGGHARNRSLYELYPEIRARNCAPDNGYFVSPKGDYSKHS